MAEPKNPRYSVVQYLLAEKEHIARLNELLQTAAEELEALIVANAGKTGATAALTNAQLRAQLAAVLAYQANMWRDIEGIIREGQKDAAAAASRVVSRYERDLLLASGMTRETLDALIAAEAQRAAAGVQNVISRILSSARPLADSVYRASAVAGGQIEDIINRALIQGWNARQLAAAVVDWVSPTTPGGASYAARRLARTEINNAFHATSIRRYQMDEMVEEVDWVLSSSHPEGDVCDDLASDGPYPVDEVPEKPHPNCFCNIRPHLPTTEEFLTRLFNGGYGTAAWNTTAPAPAGSFNVTLDVDLSGIGGERVAP